MIITEKENGLRLDLALAIHPFCKAMSARARKRLCEKGLVFINGKSRNAHYKVKIGNLISIEAEYNPISFLNPSFNLDEITLFENKDFIAFFKKSGLATQNISGSFQNSIEKNIKTSYPHIRLVNRLDTDTSGIIIATKNENAFHLWKESQINSKILKSYIALVEGKVFNSFTVANKIDISKTKVKVKKFLDEDKSRYTHVKPILSIYHKGAYKTLVDCTIYRGVRHQIRAHLAYKGFPLTGDKDYGLPLVDSTFFLHHYMIKSEYFSLFCQTDFQTHFFLKKVLELEPILTKFLRKH